MAFPTSDRKSAPVPSTVDELGASYGTMMRAVSADDDLKRRTMQRALASRSAAWPSSEKRARLPIALGLVACLALIAGAGSLVALNASSADDQPLSFVLTAYGDDARNAIANGTRGLVVLDSATKGLDHGGTDAQRHAIQGLFTGCEFHVEGEGIARIQAHVDRGEIYQVETVAYTLSGEPELASAIAGWKPELRTYDELTAKYDLVESVAYDKTVEDANEGRIKGDPNTALKTNLYQRLGETVDFDAASAESAPRIDGTPLPLTERTFGLWTNLPFKADTYEEALERGEDLAALPDRNREAALETLDGTVLTVTVTFDDGSLATQTIELRTADFKGKVIARVNGSPVVETTSEMLDSNAGKLSRPATTSVVGDEVSVRTLCGSILRETDEPFAFGAATRTDLDEPRTPVELIYEDPDANGPETPRQQEAASLRDAPWSSLAHEDLLEDAASYRTTVFHTDNNATSDSGLVTIESAEMVASLPTEITSITDLFAYYANGGTYDPSLDRIVNERQGWTIAADGTLTPGYSYVIVTETLRNDGFHPAEVPLCTGMFYAVEEDPENPDALRMKMLSSEETPLWRSGHDGPGWDAHFLFQELQPGETCTVELLYVLPDDDLHDPRLGYRYHDPERAPRERVLHLGALLS